MPDINNQKVDIFAVAKAAKTSISTVSRSFNHPQKVKPATRKRIDRAVRKLGYIRNRAAQTMHGIRSGTIGLIVPTIDHAIFSELMQAFARSVEDHGFSMLVAPHGYDLEKEYASARKFLEHRVDGIALIGQEHSEETYHLLESNRTPAISIWNYDAASRLSCVGADNVAAGRLAAQCLLDHGHRDIGLMFPPLAGNDRGAGRHAGVRQTLERAGISLRPEWVVESPYSLSEAKRHAIDMLRRPDRPSAILCGNDVLAVGTIYAAQSIGLNVPRDVSVMGIGDFKGSEDMHPALSTVRLPAKKIGHLAGDILAVSVIEGHTRTTRVNCPISLKLRNSCAAI
ncbi:HTH-type transcriptional repressor PurR [Roseobacter fucihabitans]|uniref:HTH-type transcriptional repressor PurR n=1 Tax=Roseobacter fucihabitans TaxID=1537242 RepID=A0ABZ2BPI3_9RHOB|nr:LacI family DNA-binding transcriptional regulator [Roseobacter litoralis]MBC6966705.1 HTH-type transcriptional repressor PurR [Roseobacter litoralis]